MPAPKRANRVTPPADDTVGSLSTGPARSGRVYRLPLGAGAHVVRLSGRAFEATTARLQRRPPSDLHHSALEVVTPRSSVHHRDDPDPRPRRPGPTRHRRRCGRHQVGPLVPRIPLRDPRVAQWRYSRPGLCDREPLRVSADPTVARRLLELVVSIPTPVWERDELHAGEIWNSNSVSSWLLSRSVSAFK